MKASKASTVGGGRRSATGGKHSHGRRVALARCPHTEGQQHTRDVQHPVWCWHRQPRSSASDEAAAQQSTSTALQPSLPPHLERCACLVERAHVLHSHVLAEPHDDRGGQALHAATVGRYPRLTPATRQRGRLAVGPVKMVSVCQSSRCRERRTSVNRAWLVLLTVLHFSVCVDDCRL